MMKKLVAGLAVALGATLFSTAAVHAQSSAAASGDDDAVFLVATPRLVDPAYRQTVLLVIPADNDRHIGFIINRPTQRTLSSLFPEHEPSKKVVDPVYFGGPMSRSALFAVVKTEQNPGGGSIGLMKDLFFCMRVDVVDKIIESTPNEARYYVGYVEWRPGELRAELNRGLWYVMNANKDAVFRKNSDTMWEEMQRMARAISADAAPLLRMERTPIDSLVAMLQ